MKGGLTLGLCFALVPSAVRPRPRPFRLCAPAALSTPAAPKVFLGAGRYSQCLLCKALQSSGQPSEVVPRVIPIGTEGKLRSGWFPNSPKATPLEMGGTRMETQTVLLRGRALPATRSRVCTQGRVQDRRRCLLLVGTCWPAVLTGSLAALCATPPPDHAPPLRATPRATPNATPPPQPTVPPFRLRVLCLRPSCMSPAAELCLKLSPDFPPRSLACLGVDVSAVILSASLPRVLSISLSLAARFPSPRPPRFPFVSLSVCLSLSLGPIHCSRASPSVSLLPVPPPLPVLGRSAVDGDRVQSQPCSLSRDSSELGHCRGSRQSSSVV